MTGPRKKPKDLYLRKKAGRDVYMAIKRGELASLSDSIVPCADCGERATCYDHRDYRKPLDVVAVCKGCNNRRGPGLPVMTSPPEYYNGVGHSGNRWNGMDRGDGETHTWPGECVVDVPPSAINDPRGDTVSYIWSTDRAHRFGEPTEVDRHAYFKRHDPWFVDYSVFSPAAFV